MLIRKKAIAIATACACLLTITAGCGNIEQSQNAQSQDEQSQTSDSAVNGKVSKSADGITIKQVPYEVKSTISGGDKQVMLQMTNNTEFDLVDFAIKYTVKDGITNEQIEKAFSDTSTKPKKIRKEGLACEIYGFIGKGSKAQDDCTSGAAPITDKEQLNILNPDIIGIRYLKMDTNSINTVYYDFSTGEMIDDTETELLDVWPVGSPRAGMIPQPSSTLLRNVSDDEDWGFSFTVLGATQSDYQQYVNDCASMGWQVDSNYGTSTDFAAKDGYKLSVYFHASQSELSVSLDPLD